MTFPDGIFGGSGLQTQVPLIRIGFPILDCLFLPWMTTLGYLPERDVKIVKDWLHRPFAF